MQFRLHFGLLVAFVSPLILSANARELSWRRGGTAEPQSSLAAVGQPFRQLRLAQHGTALAVRAVASDDARSPFPEDAENPTEQHSLIIAEVESPNSLRSAQLPSTPAGSEPADTPEATDADSQLEEDLRSPFIDTPAELPPLEEPPSESEIETPPLPDDQRPQLDEESRQPTVPPTQIQPRIPLVPPPGQQLPDAAPSVSEDTLEAERKKSQEACSQGTADLRQKTVDKLNLSIAVSGDEGTDYPYECTLEDAWHEGRCWDQTTYLWKASALCHKPLYFEDEQLERYGHSFPPCFQPFVSGAHFFTRLPILPYCMGVEPPYECIYALGHYRPGNCAPYMCNPVPLSVRGGLIQAGAVVGTAAALP